MKRPGRDRGDSLTGANFSFPLLGRRDLRREGNSLIKLAMSKKRCFITKTQGKKYKVF